MKRFCQFLKNSYLCIPTLIHSGEILRLTLKICKLADPMIPMSPLNTSLVWPDRWHPSVLSWQSMTHWSERIRLVNANLPTKRSRKRRNQHCYNEIEEFASKSISDFIWYCVILFFLFCQPKSMDHGVDANKGAASLGATPACLPWGPSIVIPMNLPRSMTCKRTCAGHLMSKLSPNVKGGHILCYI